MPRQSKEKKVINGVGTGRRPAPARDNYLGGDNTYDDYKTSTGYVDDRGVTTSRANYNPAGADL